MDRMSSSLYLFQILFHHGGCGASAGWLSRIVQSPILGGDTAGPVARRTRARSATQRTVDRPIAVRVLVPAMAVTQGTKARAVAVIAGAEPLPLAPSVGRAHRRSRFHQRPSMPGCAAGVGSAALGSHMPSLCIGC